GEQLRDPAAKVVDDLAVAAHPAAKVPFGRAARIYHHLKRNAETARVTEDGVVLRRQPRRAGIEVEAVGELADLVGPAGLDDTVAAANGPHPAGDPVTRLEHGHVPTGAPELVGGDEPGNAGAEDHDLAAAAPP